jgi:hypothetical protein
MKAAELIGAALSWAVAKCEGVPEYLLDKPWRADELLEHYSTDWAQGGPIIERERITLNPLSKTEWAASNGIRAGVSESPLIAAMRCYVASKLGDTVNIPAELTTN